MVVLGENCQVFHAAAVKAAAFVQLEVSNKDISAVLEVVVWIYP